ncbi:hypothetical protein NEMBOFW57_000919 [Staphylotrichum longicolle]|uniref:Autophagy-related protein 101 n=1 Tax=Staphylotrichum longicolle TaxID=669026 RepID=A0AAD4HXG6_9PEZI|nr:hypothetical protein NEMBOFW57_000919 [Staphylotrichum longicolle]
MDQRGAPEFILEAFADPNSVRDVVRDFVRNLGILHTIFFLRYFPSIIPQTRDVLGLELAYIPEAEIETLIDQRVAALVRQLESERHQPHNPISDRGRGLGLGTPPPPYNSGGGGGGGRGQITIQFLEKRRRKTWYAMRGDDEVCWESWTVKVTVADPRTEGERAKVRRASETTLHNTIMKAVTLANAHKDHIPPITTTESNPFPYQINIGGTSTTGTAPGGVKGGNSVAPPGVGQKQQRDATAAAGGGGGGGAAGAVSAAAAAAGGWATRMGIY